MAAGSKIGEAYLELRTNMAKFESELKSAKLLTGKATADMGKGIAQVEKKNKSLIKSLLSMKGALIAVGGAAAIMMAKKWVEASNRQEQAVQRLRALIKAQGGDYEALVPRIERVTAAYQRKTTYGDEVQMEAMSKLLGIVTDTQAAMKSWPLVMDLAAGAGMDLGTAAMYVGRAMEGQPEMLARYVPAIRNLSKEQRDWSNVQKILKERFAGVAEEMAKTPAGKVEQLANAWGDFQEKLGDIVKVAIVPFLNTFLKGINYLMDNWKILGQSIWEATKLTFTQLGKIIWKFFTDWSVFKAGLKLFGQFEIALLKIWGRTLEMLGKLLARVTSVIWAPLIKSLQWVVEQFWYYYQLAGQKMVKAIASAINKVSKGFIKLVNFISQKVINPIIGGFETFANSILGTISGVMSKVISLLSKTPNFILKTFGTSKEEMSKYAEDVKNKWSIELGKIPEVAENALTIKIPQTTLKEPKKFTARMSEAWKIIKSQYSKIPEDLRKYVDDLSSEWDNVSKAAGEFGAAVDWEDYKKKLDLVIEKLKAAGEATSELEKKSDELRKALEKEAEAAVIAGMIAEYQKRQQRKLNNLAAKGLEERKKIREKEKKEALLLEKIIADMISKRRLKLQQKLNDIAEMGRRKRKETKEKEKEEVLLLEKIIADIVLERRIKLQQKLNDLAEMGLRRRKETKEKEKEEALLLEKIIADMVAERRIKLQQRLNDLAEMGLKRRRETKEKEKAEALLLEKVIADMVAERRLKLQMRLNDIAEMGRKRRQETREKEKEEALLLEKVIADMVAERYLKMQQKLNDLAQMGLKRRKKIREKEKEEAILLAKVQAELVGERNLRMQQKLNDLAEMGRRKRKEIREREKKEADLWAKVMAGFVEERYLKMQMKLNDLAEMGLKRRKEAKEKEKKEADLLAKVMADMVAERHLKMQMKLNDLAQKGYEERRGTYKREKEELVKAWKTVGDEMSSAFIGLFDPIQERIESLSGTKISIKMGAVFAPVGKWFSDLSVKMTNFFKGLTGPILKGFENLFKPIFKPLEKAGKGLLGGFKGLDKIVPKLVSIFIKLLTSSKQYQKLQEVISKIIKKVSDAFGHLLTPIIKVAEAFGRGLRPLLNTISKIFLSLGTIVASVLMPVMKILAMMFGAINAILQPLAALLANILKAILPPLGTAAAYLTAAFFMVIGAIQMVVNIGIAVLNALFGAFGLNIKRVDLLSGAFDSLKAMSDSVNGSFDDLVDYGEDISDAMGKMEENFKRAWNSLMNVIMKLAHKVGIAFHPAEYYLAQGAYLKGAGLNPVAAQEGFYAKKPTLAWVAERHVPEIISPEPMMRKIVREESGRAKAGGNTFNIRILHTGNLVSTLDEEKFMRKIADRITDTMRRV